MNQNIMSISSEYIYKNELIAAEDVKDRTLPDLEMKSADQIVDGLFDSPSFTLFWFDTAGANYGDTEEKLEEEEGAKPLPSLLSTASKLNEGEAEIVSIVYNDLRNNQGLSKDHIGIISPYKAQVDLIRNKLNLIEKDGERCEVSTVDGFQGREKEVIVLSLVRSNPMHEVGFLADERRLNVAITRPKRLLIIVGDTGTVSKDPFMKVIAEKVREKGRVISVYELMKLQIENGQSEEELKKWINSGTHLSLAHLKPKEVKEGETGEGAEKKKKKKKDKKEVTQLNKGPGGAQEIVELEVEEVPRLPATTNQWGIDNDLFAKIEEYTLSEDQKSLLLYKKLDSREKEQLSNYIKGSYSLEIAFLKKNNCIKINRKGLEDTEYAKKSEATMEEHESEEEMVEKPDLEQLERERKKMEKKQRQRENKKKQQEEEERVKKMTDDEWFDMLEKEKIKKLEDQKYCPYEFVNTGKKCLKPISLLGLVCRYCEVKYCQTHVYASMHGCDEADEQFEKARFQAQHGKHSRGFEEEPMKKHEREALEAKLKKLRQEQEDKRKPLTKEQREKKDGKKKK
jgi:ATP-dependent RNA/DNA helicase IGHMBP2